MPLPGVASFGPAEPDAVLAAVVAARWKNGRSELDDMIDADNGLSPFAEYAEQVRQELAANLAEPDDGGHDVPVNPA